jgi:tetratricopeptide (TPR) repeat protein
LAPYAPLIASGQMSEEVLARTFNERGKAQFVKGFYDQAIADYDLAIHIKPDFAEALHNRGVAHEALGHIVQAKADFEAVKRLGFNLPGQL